MYWIIYFSVMAVLIIACKVLDWLNNDTWLVAICTYFVGFFGLTVGLVAPRLYIVKEDESIEAHEYCIPWYYTLDDGTRFFLHPEKTYIVNEYRKRLCLEDVQYVNKEEYAGDAPAYSYRDTVENKVLAFKSKDVAPFIEAPSYIEENCGGLTVKRVIVISLERQHFVPVDRYRWIAEEEIDWTMSYYNL